MKTQLHRTNISNMENVVLPLGMIALPLRNVALILFSTIAIVAFISLIAALPSAVYSMQMTQAEVSKSDDEGPLKWDKPKPGHVIDGINQLIIGGTNIKLYLTGGSAQIDIREEQGECLIPAGARFKEKKDGGGYGNTQKAPSSDSGTWYDNSVRRLIFLAGRSVGSPEHPLTLKGDGWLIVRGYNAVVKYRIDENSEEVLYRFPLRNPEAEAREAASQKRLRSRDPLVRAKERYVRDGGLKSESYYQNGVFNGF